MGWERENEEQGMGKRKREGSKKKGEEERKEIIGAV